MPLGDRVVYEFDEFRFDTELGALYRRGERVALQPKAAKVLALLLDAGGDCVPTETVIRQVWSESTADRSHLTFQVNQLRKALSDDAADPRIVETVRGIGLRVLPAVVSRSKGERTLGLQPHPERPSQRGPGPAMAVVADDIGPAPDTSKALVAVSAGERDEVAKTATLATRRKRVALILAVGALIGLIALGEMLWLDHPLRAVSFTPLTDDRAGKFDQPIFTDGRSVVYQVGGAYFAVPVTGGQGLPIVPSATYDVVDLNPLTAEYLGRRYTPDDAYGEIWQLPVASGIPRRLPLRCEGASWSPDATHLACAGVDKRLSISTAKGVTVRELPMPPGSTPMWPRWSPDGRRIRFTATTPEPRQASTRSLWEVFADGTGLRQVVPDPPAFTDACCGHWSPDGRYFAFQATHNGRFDLWIMPERRAPWSFKPLAPYRLTNGPFSYTSPVFSLDGRTLFAVGAPYQGEVIRYNAATREFAMLLPVSGTYVSYSPDRRAVAYIGFPDKRLWRANADGTEARPLTVGPFEANDSSWSPDSRWIAFRSRMNGRNLRIHLIDPAGGEARPISPEDKEQGTPTWSPDGRKLVFGEVPSAFGKPDGGEALYIYDVDTGQYSVVPDSSGLWSARWSPDGRFIAATTIADNELRIYDFETAKWRSIGVAHVGSPAWSSDASYIYYRSVGLPPRHVERVRIADGRVERLFDLSGLREAYWWLGLAPDDSPLLMRFLGGAEVYALELEH